MNATPTRTQLAAVFKDPQLVRAFESLFQKTEVTTPSQVAAVVDLAGAADNKADEAITRLDNLRSPTVSILLSDVVNADVTANTLYDVNGLDFGVFSGRVYWFEATVYYTAAATSTGSIWTINGPTFDMLSYSAQWPINATSATISNRAAYDLPTTANASSAATSGNIAQIRGIIKPNDAGTVVVRFASGVSGSAITAKAGSILKWLDITP
jgi:hypothetical protein